MGRKAKTIFFLEKKNLELGKNLMGNWGLTRFLIISKRHGSIKWGFQKQGERMGKIFRERKGSRNKK